MSKQFWGVIIAIIVVLGGIFYFTNHKSNNGNSGDTSTNTNTPSHNVEGLGQDHINLVEYGDYQCPFCGEYYSIVKQVEATYNDQITFQFVNFPLVSIHQNAFAGARAAQAAALQNKFWQMHDLLYEENQIYYDSNESASTWVGATDPETYFDQYASQLGLNVAEFERDYASTQVDDTITADLAIDSKMGLDETPTFFLDGKQVTPTDTVASFEKILNGAIKAKGYPIPAATASAGS